MYYYQLSVQKQALKTRFLEALGSTLKCWASELVLIAQAVNFSSCIHDWHEIINEEVYKKPNSENEVFVSPT